MIKDLSFSAAHTCCDVCAGTDKVLVGFQVSALQSDKKKVS